jgi:threonine/homoserine/homoserine lactone efflux protein
MNLLGLPGAIVLLLFAATVTPGPNNLLMLRIGLEGGLHAALAPATGVVLGGVAMLLLTYAGVAAAFARPPRSAGRAAWRGSACG